MNRFMEEAIRLARDKINTLEGGPFGAVVVHDDSVVIGRGWNRVTSTADPTAHAEIVAIREACRRLGSFQLEGCDIYSTCEPCPMCLGAIYWARPARVFYASTRADAAAAGFDDAFIYEEIARPLQARRIPMEPLMRQEALVVFEEGSRLDGRTEY